MPRTAVILGQTHKGEWKLLSTPSDDIIKQVKQFRELQLKQWDDTFQRITYQESDGTLQTKVLRNKESQQVHEDRRAKELETSVAAKKRFEDSCEAAAKEVGAVSAAKYQQNVEAENKRRSEAQAALGVRAASQIPASEPAQTSEPVKEEVQKEKSDGGDAEAAVDKKSNGKKKNN